MPCALRWSFLAICRLALWLAIPCSMPKQGPGFYWAYERFIRMAEGKVDSWWRKRLLDAIRRHLFQQIPADALLDDVFTPMQIVLQGYRVVYHPGVKVYDHEASIAGEFSRKARTLAVITRFYCNYRKYCIHENRLFFQFVSHKLLRLICPFAL